jgi:hypothetical protein
MTQTKTITLTLDTELMDFVSTNSDANQYIINLIRQDMQLHDKDAFEKLNSKLRLAYSEPDSSYYEFTIHNVLNGSKYGYL